MKNYAVTLFIILLLFAQSARAKEYIHILNDDCINELYTQAQNYFQNYSVEAIRDSRGILLRFELENPIEEFKEITPSTYRKTICIKDFLAKIKNPAIIEVHTGKIPELTHENLKKWEVSTVIANKIESVILEPKGMISQDRINSVGYGEFLPSKNTPYNGGKYLNRVDIMILCNVSGE